MLSLDFTFLWTLINLIILYLLLKKFLFKRVGDFMEKRAAGIQNDITQAEESKKAGEAYAAEQEALVNKTRHVRESILLDARRQAEVEAAKIVAEAKAEATRVIAAANAAADNERERVLTELKAETVELALLAATKVIEANMDTDKNRFLVREFLEKQAQEAA